MALSIDAKTVKRSDLLAVTPEDIIVSEDDRGRSTPPSDVVIKALALSILTHGQRQAVECRKATGNKLALTMGFTRHAAVSLIRQGFEHNGVEYGDPEYLLKTTVVTTNAETAFINNIVENAHRNATSPIDDAINMQKLRDRYGKDDVEIAGLYRCTVTHVQRMSGLLGLSAKHQSMVHEKAMPVSAALDLLEVDESERDAIIDTAIEGKPKVDGTLVKSAVRKKIIEKAAESGDDAKPAKNSKTQRTVKEVRAFFEVEAKATGESHDFAQAMVDFINGTITDEAFKTEFDALFNNDL